MFRRSCYSRQVVRWWMLPLLPGLVFALTSLGAGCGGKAGSRGLLGLVDAAPSGAAGAAGRAGAAGTGNAGSTGTSGAGEGEASDPGAEAQSLLVERAGLLRLQLGGELDERWRVNMAQLCVDVACPTLEQVLGLDECAGVAAGCGLWQVRVGSTSYWYDAFGVPPVGVSTLGQADGAGPWAAARALGCDQLQTVCSTCGRNLMPRCADEVVWPELPASAPVPGCACDADQLGDRHVSLECFCSIYPCPAYETSLLDCPPDPGDSYSTVRVDDSCGWIWVHGGARSGQAWAYDRASKQLVSAVAFSNGPVTAPCSNSYRVWAGPSGSCPAGARSCRCNGVSSAYLVAPGRGEIPDACEEASWFDELLVAPILPIDAGVDAAGPP
ncbi:MAG: hypothetical protein RL685_4213 [Pseudomonadota bacterium]|jgi:hypothetical protein